MRRRSGGLEEALEGDAKILVLGAVEQGELVEENGAESLAIGRVETLSFARVAGEPQTLPTHR